VPTADLQIALTMTLAQRCALLLTLRLLRQRIFSSEIRFAPFGRGRSRKFNGSHTRNVRFSVTYGRASAQFRCCLTRPTHPLTASVGSAMRGERPAVKGIKETTVRQRRGIEAGIRSCLETDADKTVRRVGDGVPRLWRTAPSR
jgi:hypothetical protein